ncbi:MAG: hypothetical protein WEC34_08410 [Acidimicrobiia bacterium]
MAIRGDESPNPPDTAEYLAVARANVLSVDFWGAIRAPVYPLLLRGVFFDVDAAIVVQTALSIGAWIVLACVVASCVRGLMRPIAFLVVLGFGASSAVTLWNRWVLTESVGTSLVALMLATALIWSRRHDDRMLVVIAGLAAVFMLLRDSFVPVGAVAVALALLWCLGRRSIPTRPIAIALVGLAVVVAATVWSIAAGQRGDRSMTNVVTLRVLKDDDATQFFVEHGLPLTRELESFRGRLLIGRSLGDSGPPPDMKALARPLRWISERGQTTYLLYVFSHPDTMVSMLWSDLDEIFESPFDVYGSLSGVDGWPVWSEALSSLLVPPTAVLAAEVGLAAMLSGILVRRRRAPPAIGVVWCFVAVGLLHAVVAWIGDPFEVSRHSVLANVSVRIGIITILLIAVDALVADSRGRNVLGRRGRDASSQGSSGRVAGR